MVTDLQPSRQSSQGFTLVELLIGATISGVITLGVITSFTFLGRNMVRIANNSELQSRAAIASATVQKDVANTDAVVAISSTGMTLTVNTGAGTDTITYAYDTNSDQISRTDSSNTYVLLRKVTAGTFTFTDSNGNTTSTATSVKKIELDATTATGGVDSGTYVTHQLVSPAMIVAGSGI
ncbi:MAG: prepilin-type N-terminal cleavage/methylation domain-containing protein [Opitutaceae bacterium]|jgi:prepilin-type N-terminal cleavage/methylation domain-containing protein|nr:prepilin-type N-terminal cleavage/methylation domain-containing protein [Opitutaceae bacterium]